MGVNAQTLQFSLCIAIFCVMGMQMIGKCAKGGPTARWVSRRSHAAPPSARFSKRYIQIQVR